MGEAKNIAGEWGVDKSHGGEQKIRGGGLSRGVLLRGVNLGTQFQKYTHFYGIREEGGSGRPPPPPPPFI